MDYLLVCASAALIAVLTFFCGFGLGTLLMPVLAAFFPVDLAIAATAVVHLANNLFKAALVGRHADRGAVARFGLPAVAGAFAGAALLSALAALPELASYSLGGRTCQVTLAKLLVGVLILAFAAFDLWPPLRELAIGRRWLALGGLLSGFFGGLSGHQGALRSAFLIKLGLTGPAFIATGVIVAVMVDVARLAVYGAHFATAGILEGRLPGLVAAASAAAFAGSFAGSRLLMKVTIGAIRTLVGLMLVGMGVALGAGVI